MSPSHDDKKNRAGKAKGNQESVMLQAWLNEPEDITSATDVWSAQRAIAQPRQYIGGDKSYHPNYESGGAAKAA
ncbi:hypothetical protein NW762_004023 [Fusarium torreyae]|uniref:Uncharacterized protein n=1 Tax=Fusarium torreyae TaxID=1237075 RepID=A0A9W8S6C2_9HYPO|nr:hypothetical protein NW762_004023 [Fusarium torreyae]